jgi:hypothetical protein
VLYGDGKKGLKEHYLWPSVQGVLEYQLCASQTSALKQLQVTGIITGQPEPEKTNKYTTILF